jgi:CBS domain-containing protein
MLGLGLGAFVTYNPQAVSPDTPLADSLRLMQEHGCHHLPVTNRERRIVGIVSDLDAACAVESRQSKRTCDLSEPRHCVNQGRVEDIMMRSVCTVDQCESPRMALEAILKNHFHSAPVVEDNCLVGMVTSTDFLREFSCGYSPVFNDPVSWHMSPPSSQIAAGASLDAAIEELSVRPTRHLIVTQDERPIGVVSGRACHRAKLIAKGYLQPAPTDERPVHYLRDLVAAPHVTLSPDQTLGHAAALLLEQELRALVVIDRLGRPAGILREDDILNAMLDHVA